MLTCHPDGKRLSAATMAPQRARSEATSTLRVCGMPGKHTTRHHPLLLLPAPPSWLAMAMITEGEVARVCVVEAHDRENVVGGKGRGGDWTGVGVRQCVVRGVKKPLIGA